MPKLDLTGVRREDIGTLEQSITRTLRQAILSGKLAPGTYLTQEELAAYFGVSRIPVRESLLQLQSEGLVTVVPRRGARVSSLSPAEIGELFELRAALEALLTRTAVPKLQNSHIDRSKRILQAMDALDDPGQWTAFNREFHETLYELAQRPMILKQVHDLRNNAERFVRLSLMGLHRYDRAHREHWSILVACEARDARLAAELTEQHLLNVGEELKSYLEQAGRGATG